MKDDIIAPAATTLSALFRERVKRTPQNIAYRYFDKDNKVWQSLTWADMSAHVAQWQTTLAQENLVPGDKVAIMLPNSPEWVMFDQAALGLGLVTVPLYLDDRADNVAYIITEAEVKFLLLGSATQWKRLYPVRDELSALTRIVSVQPFDDKDFEDARLINLDTWLSNSKEVNTPRVEECSPKSLASIVYTSGTTGRPKGVMLSHHNILSNAQATSQCTYFGVEDLFLSFLPLSHTFERTGGYYLPMVVGATVAYARSIPQLGVDLTTLCPTILVSVPRIYEQVYAKIQNQLTKKSWLARTLFGMAINVGWRHFEYRQKRAGWHPKLLLWPLLRRLVATPVLNKLGGRLRFAISGGAALSPTIAKLFIALGLDLLQGYGLTETSPVISVNRPEDNVPKSIGLTLPEIDIKIGENDELLTKSPYIMMGYWKNPTATRQMIDEEGWLHTGDKAYQDEQGHLYITGRIKEIIVMGNGEKVPPADMEITLCTEPLFEQVMVIGEGKPFLGALIVLNAEQWQEFAKKLNINPDQSASLQIKPVHQEILTRISKHIKGFPGYAQIRRVSLSLESWTPDSGLLTPTMKMKRPKILEHYAVEIEQMYKGY
ncbi:long-chain fatty acid--CoA ligase [Candidatus Parabeggiatoa sp. HSG14]|uniref:AMP-dependent synthetase/ligase n=1 Tax=Candidatus Parabeggiatoa sp. HSG14 TaxID=3055593 RepID=UPI0025A7C017|nr:long-chain fatty acid--CoA ligase [Thiotrichales bacterium HSG14]